MSHLINAKASLWSLRRETWSCRHAIPRAIYNLCKIAKENIEIIFIFLKFLRVYLNILLISKSSIYISSSRKSNLY